MILLINFNTYIGGGETLAVRFSDFLRSKNIKFKTFCLRDSYIAKDLKRIGLPVENIVEIENNPNYYYLSNKKREKLRNDIENHITPEQTHIVTFCLRDLYSVIDIRNDCPNTIITHLILHDQDNLYACQSLLDKIRLHFFHKQVFSRKSHIKFNSYLLNVLSHNGCVIPQSDLQVQLWKNKFGINLEYSMVVPLPVCDFSKIKTEFSRVNRKRIIWVGRIVDFKIPALCAMISFVNRHQDYSLTVVGDGNKQLIDKYIVKNTINSHNITFIGQVDYANLSNIIIGHDIGYAMGTSIVEIAKLGIPVIMALGAPAMVKFKKEICGGLYVSVTKGNVGDDLYCGQPEDAQPLIEDVIHQIDKNYQRISKDCFECVKGMFDSVTNMEKYLKIIMSSNRLSIDTIIIPQASWLRAFLFNNQYN